MSVDLHLHHHFSEMTPVIPNTHSTFKAFSQQIENVQIKTLFTAAVTPTCERDTTKPMEEKEVPELLSLPPPAECGQGGGVSSPHRRDESGPRLLPDRL